jgi:hypothetical protein
MIFQEIFNTSVAHASISSKTTTICYPYKSSIFFSAEVLTIGYFLQFRLRARCYLACDLAAKQQNTVPVILDSGDSNVLLLGDSIIKVFQT